MESSLGLTFRYTPICLDVTLPSCLAGSPGSLEIETDKKSGRVLQPPDSRRSSSLLLVNVYQEMMTIYNQLKVKELNRCYKWSQEPQRKDTYSICRFEDFFSITEETLC